MVNFDEVINRVDSDSFKWDAANRALGSNDYIQMGCADMDFKAPVEIIEELKKAVEFGIFGYVTQSKTFEEGIIKWYQERHGVEIAKQSIVYTPKVVIAASLCVEAFSRPGDSIILNSPYYPPLDEVSLANGRRVIEPPLEEREGRYVMNLEKLETLIDSKTKIMILVSPHNPTTRIWTQEELEQIADFCVRHKIILFVDEIHSDFVKSGHKFISMAAIKGPIQDLLVLANAPSKTFNVMGCQISYLIIPNAKLRAAMSTELDRIAAYDANTFGNALMKVAYQKCAYYIDELNSYIDGNEEFMRTNFKRVLPKAIIKEREGTFLLWVDFNEQFSSEAQMMSFFRKAKINFLPGSHFGPHFHNFARINIGCPRATLQEVINRIEQALQWY